MHLLSCVSKRCCRFDFFFVVIYLWNYNSIIFFSLFSTFKTLLYTFLAVLQTIYTSICPSNVKSFSFHNCFCMHICSFTYVYIPNCNVLSPCYITYVQGRGFDVGQQTGMFFSCSKLYCVSSIPLCMVESLWVFLCRFLHIILVQLTFRGLSQVGKNLLV